jgi:predicted MPP superfamily phosphohydrolase
MQAGLQENPAFGTQSRPVVAALPDGVRPLAPVSPSKRSLSRHRKPRDFAALRQAMDEPSPPVEITSSGPGPWLQYRVPTGFVWKKVNLPIANLPPALAGLRLLHLSDFHLRDYWGQPYDDLIERVRVAMPDLILITGDIIENKVDPRPALPIVRRLIPNLRSRLGIYAIQGNHDPDALMPHLPELGVRIVTHRRVELGDGDTRFELIGLTGHSPAELDMEFLRGLPQRQAGVPRVVMCHYPDLFGEAQALEPDLYLAGHTHGGQICLPSGRPVLTHDRMPRRFAKGIHRIGRTWFVVSQGMGFSGPAIRLFCPAEVMEISLLPQAGTE